MGPATQHHVRSAVLTIQSRVSPRMSEPAAPAESHFPPRDLPGAVPSSGRESGEETQTSLLCTEAFIGEGSEFMDHREVQIESSENTAGAGAWRGGCGLDGLPGSPGALVPVP